MYVTKSRFKVCVWDKKYFYIRPCIFVSISPLATEHPIVFNTNYEIC